MTGLDQLPTTYDPTSVEPLIRALWEEGNFFHAEPSHPGKAYTIMIPPPNVTGALHGGHALNNTLQDILVRWRRMQGCNTLWMPGTDHAGIATQAVVERTIFETEKKSRHDLGREELVRRIWEWKENYGNRILSQLNRMGCSCDWARTRFTLDDTCARAVRHTFFKLFRDGLIVRGKRLVNWDTQLQTAVADDEVYHETVKGHLWHIRYPLKKPIVVQRDGRDVQISFLIVATTRPETMLGDTAVAVHPEDERWQRLIGEKVVLPLLHREIPVVADPILVDRAFGSGCVKVTPAHDPNDYACGQRNDLEFVNILTPDGRVNENGGPYAGLDRYEARKKVVADLEDQGLIERIDDHESDVGHSDRSKSPIEPYLSDQWFVRMGDLPDTQAGAIEGLRGSPGLAQLAIDSVAAEPLPTVEERRESGQVHFFPARYRKTYVDWLSEKRDWCISRQLWWGHRIPVWARRFELDPDNAEKELLGAGVDALIAGNWGTDDRLVVRVVREETEERLDDPADILKPITGATAGAYLISVCLLDDDPEAIRMLEQAGFVQDPDVLDTWFSSALWPHSTLGWPESTPELQSYYPGSVLSTAREIITLWVARMVITGMYNLGKVPFHDVYIHAVIQDGQGRPFKKTLGNGYDPVDIIEVYGADALRYTMAVMTTETQDIRMPMKRITLEDGRELQTSERFEQGRNFCNKVWNAARFAFLNLSDTGMASIDVAALPVEDRWILAKVHRAAVEVQDALADFQFSRAMNLARDFFWDALCDWYLELVKSRIKENRQADEARQVLAFALDQALRLLHPFVPFLTERLWMQLNEMVPQRGLPGVAELDAGKPLIVSSYPPEQGWDALADERVEALFSDLQTATRAVRDIRQTQNVPPKQAVDVAIKAPADRVVSLQQEAHVIRYLAHVGEIIIDPDAAKPRNAATLVLGDLQIYVADVIDPKTERARLTKELANLDKQITGVTNKLSNENFTSRAPEDVVNRERERLAELKAQRNTVIRTMDDLGG